MRQIAAGEMDPDRPPIDLARPPRVRRAQTKLWRLRATTVLSFSRQILMDIVDPKIEAWLHEQQASKDPVLLDMEQRAKKERFPIIGPLVGRFVHQMALAISARDVFELG